MTKFSIIIPTHNRVLNGLLRRAMISVLGQTYSSWECIVVDDGSTEPIAEAVEAIGDARFKLVSMPKRGERLRAWNAGFEAAEGEWICMLCSDDIYLPHYCQVLTQAMEVYPDAMVFNFQELNVRGDARIWTRALFEPKRLEKGHVPFKSGKISMGNFVFKRECLDTIGMFPDVNSYWKLAEIAKEEFPFLRKWYPGTRETGNPYGEDHFCFLRLTRHWTSVALPAVLMCKMPSKGKLIRFDEFERKRLEKESQK